MYQSWRLHGNLCTSSAWWAAATVMLVLTSVLRVGCAWQEPMRSREPKLLWKTELPRPWPNMVFSMPISDREDKIVVVTGMGELHRKERRLYQDVVCCVADAASGKLIDIPTHCVELGERSAKAGQSNQHGGVMVNFYSFKLFAAHPTTFPCGPDWLVVVLERLGFRFYIYHLKDKKWIGPFLTDPLVGYQPSDLGLAQAEVFWDKGKMYCFQPTASIAVKKDNTTERYTEYDLIEYDLTNPQAKGKKLFAFRANGGILDIVRPVHPGDASLKWRYVLDDKEYIMEYNSDTDKVNVLVEKNYDINNTELTFGPNCVYSPHKNRLIQAKGSILDGKTWLVEKAFGEKGGKTVWPARPQEETIPYYLIATPKFDKLALLMEVSSEKNNGSFEHYLMVILDAVTYRERYRWIETVWGLYGAQFSRDGKRLYVATTEPIDRKARDVKYKHYLKCYQLAE